MMVLVAILLAAHPVLAQDFSRLDMTFGYGNYGVSGFQEFERVNGFILHTDVNLTSYFTVENVTGAYRHPGDVTLITNTFGVKLVARDVVDGRISPYVAGGLGVGYYSSNLGSFAGSTSANRYAFGIDLNMSEAMAVRFDVGGLRLGSGIYTGGGKNAMHVGVGIVFSLGN